MKRIKAEKGITLVALIITIIVLLILAVVAIRAVQGDGILKYAQNSTDEYQAGADEENRVLDTYLEKIEENVPGGNGTNTDDEETDLAPGLYKIDGTFITWADLISNGTLIVSDGVLTCGEEKQSIIDGKLVIDESVITIGGWGFQDCTLLNNVIIPSTVTNIGRLAFGGCTSLSNITIPSTVTNIEMFAFEDTLWLTAQRVANSENNSLVIINNILIDGWGATGDVIIPEGVIEIVAFSFGNYMAGGNNNITSVIIPSTVEVIEQSAFGQCDSLTTVTIEVGNLTSIEINAFFGCDVLATVNYTGTEADWNDITIADNNDQLTDLTPNYNYVI